MIDFLATCGLSRRGADRWQYSLISSRAGRALHGKPPGSGISSGWLRLWPGSALDALARMLRVAR